MKVSRVAILAAAAAVLATPLVHFFGYLLVHSQVFLLAALSPAYMICAVFGIDSPIFAMVVSLPINFGYYLLIFDVLARKGGSRNG